MHCNAFENHKFVETILHELGYANRKLGSILRGPTILTIL
jgi:hypothetical protein